MVFYVQEAMDRAHIYVSSHAYMKPQRGTNASPKDG